MMNIPLDAGGLPTAFLTLCTAFILTVIMGPWCIPALKRLKFGQEVRDDGPQSHLKKQGTPTMGGAFFLTAFLLASLLGFLHMKNADIRALQILFLTVGFGITGFLDDYLKIQKHQSEGLTPKQKMLLQFAITVVFAFWVWRMPEGRKAGDILVPFTGFGDTALKLPLPVWIYLPFVVFVVLGTDNGANFTDGLDGLCSSVTAVLAAFFLAVGLLFSYPGLSLVSGAMTGCLLGFLIFNVYPAKVFMGDTGSLALGGFVAAAAVTCGMELYLPVIALVYMAEVLSVIIQVSYFKATHGKRFFKMAPIHHHFELLGNSETRIVAAFTIITILLCGAAFLGASYLR